MARFLERQQNIEQWELGVEPYFRSTESDLFHYFEPSPGLFMAESPNVIRRALQAGYEPLSFLAQQDYLEQWEDIWENSSDSVVVYLAKKEDMEKLPGFHMTRGLLSLMKRKALQKMDSICDGANRIVVLCDVMNPTNVGAIFRNAAALDMDGILLTKGCSDPLYRRAARVSMGTVFQIPWTFMSKSDKAWENNLIEALHKWGYKTVTMALLEDSMKLPNEKLKQMEKLAILLGTESTGLPKSIIENSDFRVTIPMSNGVDSLNVAAASAIAFWELKTLCKGI